MKVSVPQEEVGKGRYEICEDQKRHQKYMARDSLRARRKLSQKSTQNASV